LKKYRFVQLDVFTEHAFSGNPLAVFPEAEGLDDALMQSIAREMNLSETVFVVPSEKGALRRLRIFTPGRELPMAGHPVVGTWNALAREGVVAAPESGAGTVRIQQELGIGVLPVDIEFKDGKPTRVVMTQGKFRIIREVHGEADRADIAKAVGLTEAELDTELPIQVASTGVPMLLVPVATLESLGRCRVNTAVLNEVGSRLKISEWYLFTRDAKDKERSGAHARLFAPDLGIAEDPATGGAAGPLGGYLVFHNALKIEPRDGAYRFEIEQGDFMHRPSRIGVEITGAPGNVELVRVGGPSVVVAKGELMF
jgi:trans-2,3-dihydro-3-hydroxyanthranilate isomerase